MDGVLFSKSSRRFTYYDAGMVQASGVVPWGGPAAGGTMLRVSGKGFGDYSSRAGAVRWQGLRCMMGSLSFTPGTREKDGFGMACRSPDNPFGVAVLPSESVPGLVPNASALTVRSLEVTLNGQTNGDALTASKVAFAYYEDNAFTISRLHPAGGPSAGGTNLSILLAAASLHADLGGLLCKFVTPVREVEASALSSRTTRRHSPKLP